MGDPAGVGPELCLQILTDVDLHRICHPIVVGDFSILSHVAKRLGKDLKCSVVKHPDVESLRSVTEPTIYDVAQIAIDQVSVGKVSGLTGKAAYEYVRIVVEQALADNVHGIVTGPIHKEAFHLAGVPYPGHTELLGAMTKCDRFCMMLTSDELTCSFVTAHVGLREVSDRITERRVLEVIQLTYESLQKRLARSPKLVVCALNPHAGEHGLFGDREEERAICPAIDTARSLGIEVHGPVPPDTAFLACRRAETDAYVCMYHDQGLIPLKALCFETAVNVTIGLPIVRSSVDHGTALDIAWQGKVDPTSMRCAIRWAATEARMRKGD